MPRDAQTDTTLTHKVDLDFGGLTNDPANSYTLPAEAYTSPVVWEAEKEKIFYREWNFVGIASSLAEEGAYKTLSIGDQNIAVVRGKDGQLRAVYNVCAHRAHELLNGEGVTNSIKCPYHAWVYELDGTLRPNPAIMKTPGFDTREFCLKTVRIEEFCGFIFVNLDPEAKPMSQVYGGFEEEFRKHFPDPAKLVLARRDHYDIKANWKNVVDNFLECYHCPPAHPAFAQLVDMSRWSTVPHERHVTFSSPVKNSESIAYKLDESAGAQQYFGMWMWPGVAFNVFPGELAITVYHFIPDGAERTLEHIEYYAPSTEVTPTLKAAADYIDTVLQPEDIGIVESVQRGLHSKGYGKGRFVCSSDPARPWEHEDGVHKLHLLVRDALES